LKALRAGIRRLPAAGQTKPDRELDPDLAADIIIQSLESPNPSMIARFGSTELSCLVNYTGVVEGTSHPLDFVLGKRPEWWWNPAILQQMEKWSGFFPPTEAMARRFGDLMLRDIPLIDVLGSWVPDERVFNRELTSARKVDLELLNPYFSKVPWTKALAGRKVLVIHPFSATIQSQYAKRELIFPDGLLPKFELTTIRAVQSLAGEPTGFDNWFEALDSMVNEMERTDFDICLVGCGAYGLPLAAHAKRMGKKGFHLGGSLQLLFGIRGKRWENPGYNDVYDYSKLMNAHWVKPGEEERPKSADKVEGACYW
jgi:hypothetical protein